jgi:ribosomal-protein-alanine N-acetyltransferase
MQEEAAIFIKGEKIHLRSLESRDVFDSCWAQWFDDEETTFYMQQHYYPNSKEKQLNFFESEIKNNVQKCQLGICSAEDNSLIGMVSLQNIDHLNRKAEFSIVIGEKDKRRSGLSREALLLILRHGFDALNLRKIYSGTLIEAWAKSLCDDLGFVSEGTLKEDVFKHGRYWDVHLVALFEDVYREFHESK